MTQRRLRTTAYSLFALLLGLVMAGSLTAVAQESTPVAAGSFTVSGLVDNPGELTVADLAEFEAETVEVSYLASGNQSDNTFTGTNFYAFLESFGLQIPEEPHNAHLGMVAKLTATDGYVTVISLGEIDPGFGGAPMLLAWEQNGEALALPRLVVPGDERGGRYISDVISIEIILV